MRVLGGSIAEGRRRRGHGVAGTWGSLGGVRVAVGDVCHTAALRVLLLQLLCVGGGGGPFECVGRVAASNK